MPKKIMENNGNVSKAMKEVGYSKNYSKNPQTLIKSKGFKEVCDKAGLTDDFIVDCLTSDITDKPRNRVQELNLATKIKGLQSDKLDITSNGQQITGFTYIKPDAQNDVLKPVKEPINTKQP